MTSISGFLYRKRHGTLEDDATWRAYDIPAAVKRRHVRDALKAIGLAYAGELAVPQFMALYEVPTQAEAEAALGGWWLWSQIAKGRPMRVPLRSGVTPLAGGQPNGP